MRRSFIFPLSIGIILGLTVPYLVFRFTHYDIWGIALATECEPNPDIIGDIVQNKEDWERISDNNPVANALGKKVRVLCWIMTHPGNHKKKARHVKATWAKRCNTVLFMSSVEDESLPSIALPVKEGRQYLWGKTKEAFKYVYNHYNGSYDWVLKADDDTFVIMENLRYLLNIYDPEKAFYLGCRFHPFVKLGYMQGGAGYVLSKEAVKKFVVDGLGGKRCRMDDGDDKCAEDVEMGRCMEILEVEVRDTRDHLNRNRFHPSTPLDHLIPKYAKDSFWHYYNYYPTEDGLNRSSDTAISFHYVNPFNMYLFYYFLYHLRPYGIDNCIGEEHSSTKNSSNASGL